MVLIVDLDLANTWVDDVLPKLVSDYTNDCIYNADETGLFWKMKPEYSLYVRGAKSSDDKKCKDRLTILFCTNADGSDKHMPFVIGMSKKPRCFQGVKKLPVAYDANNSAWMNTDLFQKWLLSFDTRMKIFKKKIILFLDNFSGHKVTNLNLENIRIEFYPPNCTSILQPLDQGIIRAFKNHYRTKLLSKIISKIDRVEIDDEINILDALEFLSIAWKMISQQTIINCFSVSGLKNLIISFPMTATDE